MKWVTFRYKNIKDLHTGLFTEKGVINLISINNVLQNQTGSDLNPQCHNLYELINNEGYYNNLIEAYKKGWFDSLPTYQEEDIHYEPPVVGPNKMICLGMNFLDHIKEIKKRIPTALKPTLPLAFSKYSTSLTGHLSTVLYPDKVNKLDYEIEVAIYIGKDAYKVKESEALDYVFGYSIFNDITARDLQEIEMTSGLLLGCKNFPTFGPIGPYLVTKEEISNPNELNMLLSVNGEVRQNSSTNNMIFSIEEIISYWSSIIPLKPGDIITTGTPAGVAFGSENNDLFLKSGDHITATVEGLGSLVNVVR